MTTAAKELGEEPAFAQNHNSPHLTKSGCTKRELFAAMMAAGYCGNSGLNKCDSETINVYALRQTDALLEQLARQS